LLSYFLLNIRNLDRIEYGGLDQQEIAEKRVMLAKLM